MWTSGQFKNRMEQKTFSFNGLQLSYYESGSPKKPAILFTHANGYSAGCYRYYQQNLAKDYHVFGLDFSGHGNSESSMAFKNWFFFRNQILALISHLKIDNLTGIGHSLGGATLLMAAYREKQLFNKLILFDPTILNLLLVSLSKLFGNPLSKTAAQRRQTFNSLDIVRKGYKRAPAFRKWNSDIFEDYLNSCLRRSGDGYELCCDPALEAKIFKVHSLSSHFQFGKIKTETHILTAENSEVCTPKAAKKIQKNNPHSSFEELSDASHFFPFEIPELTLEKIYKRLS